jgi:OmpA-OmpF porin, OOP family
MKYELMVQSGLVAMTLFYAKASPLDVKFEFARANLKLNKSAEVQFDAAARELKNYPFAKLGIEGYTDAIGPDALNQKLSEERALAVRRHFIEHHGIPPNRIFIKPFGKGRPEASNATLAGRRENRRAVARVYRLEPNETELDGHSL